MRALVKLGACSPCVSMDHVIDRAAQFTTMGDDMGAKARCVAVLPNLIVLERVRDGLRFTFYAAGYLAEGIEP